MQGSRYVDKIKLIDIIKENLLGYNDGKMKL